MNIILVIASVIVLAFFILGQVIKYWRFTHINALRSAYDRMEMFFVENNIVLSNEYVELLKIFKNLSVNPDFLDIQMLTLSKMATTKSGNLEADKKWFDKTIKSLGEGFDEIFKEFDTNSNKIIALSVYKPDFLFFGIKIICKYFLISRARSLARMRFEYRFLLNNEGAISYSGMKLAKA